MIKAILYSILLVGFLFTEKVTAQDHYTYPDKEWEYTSENSPCSPMNLLKQYVIDSLNTTGLMIIKSGKIDFEYGDTEEISYLASARKSVLSMMYGKYVIDGTINLNTTLKELDIDDVNSLTETEKQATIDQIINARSGVYLPAANAGSGANMPERGQFKPGEHFYYNNWDFNVAGTIFEQKTGNNIYKAFEDEFAIPLGFQDFELANQKKYGNEKLSIHPAYHFYLSTRDMARLGYLMLRKGKWNDKQIIPENWINKTTTMVSKTEDYGLFKGYSYMWWLYVDSDIELLEGAYTAAGAWGQYITIIPKLDMVIAHKTKSRYERRTPIPAYDKFIVKLIEGEKQVQNTNKNIDLRPFVGSYTDNSVEGQPLNLEMIIDGESLKIKGPIFPQPVNIVLCSETNGVLDVRDMGYPSLAFKKDQHGKILGFNIMNMFIEKN
ncbi:serine hydrolase domain-containing protein [Winogradskyella schleiferi]|uniref:serine hydrolase domain-containing protein n=1 Tax=Winogradskyella schleiferi TaxID=2686078 RepID=UPI0015B7C9D8|nr:serine hydrolase [Winogradskyella schleiferi]